MLLNQRISNSFEPTNNVEVNLGKLKVINYGINLKHLL